MKGAFAMLKDFMINIMIAGVIYKAHDLLTKPGQLPKQMPSQCSTEADLEKAFTGCAVFIGIIFVFIILCVIYMAVTDLPCFR